MKKIVVLCLFGMRRKLAVKTFTTERLLVRARTHGVIFLFIGSSQKEKKDKKNRFQVEIEYAHPLKPGLLFLCLEKHTQSIG